MFALLTDQRRWWSITYLCVKHTYNSSSRKSDVCPLDGVIICSTNN